MTHLPLGAEVYVATRATAAEVELPYNDVATSAGYVVLRLAHSAESVRLLAAALRDGRILGGAIVNGLLPVNHLWLAHEWHDALVVLRGGAVDDVQPGPEWVEDDYRHPTVRVFRLVANTALAEDVEDVERAAEFLEALHGKRPTTLDLTVTTETARNRALFGELADPRVGGAVALLVLSGARAPGDWIRLRNPAALDLDWVDDPRSASALRSTGQLTVTAAGLSHSSSDVGAGFSDPDGARRLWAHRTPSSFHVLLEAAASVDPELFVPLGQVFEQRGANGVQTLATTRPDSVVVTPGRLGRLLLPAWCLNQDLAAPSGEPVRPTPLRTRYPSGTSQKDVWTDRARVSAR